MCNQRHSTTPIELVAVRGSCESVYVPEYRRKRCFNGHRLQQYVKSNRGTLYVSVELGEESFKYGFLNWIGDKQGYDKCDLSNNGLFDGLSQLKQHHFLEQELISIKCARRRNGHWRETPQQQRLQTALSPAETVRPIGDGRHAPV